MCVAIPGKVVKIKGNIVVVDIMGASKEIAADLVDDINIGDYLLVHAGCAIEKIDEEEARKTIELFEELKEIVDG